MFHDDSFNDLTQQFFLIAALQAIIQRSNLGDNFQRQVQIIDVNLVFLLHRFKGTLNSLSAILPFCPHPCPNLIRNSSSGIESGDSRFFFINLLQGELELSAPIRA
ncbi:MAG: hypothetical protein IPK17_12875 [Chloroflexi bacterium]|uniref:hypothetical protein n=1 Tax=Candidatus Flexifilum breve TaxID=3140694 RepID=UPI0031365705|nr:hypothetical protein [Chloroflexota bacterium]